MGGTLPFELSRFTTVTVGALQETPLTQPLGGTERIAAAHQLLQVSTSRAAQHILFLSNIRWRDAERRQPQVAEITAPLRANTETAEAAGHTALYRRLGEDGKALFPAAMQVIAATTPTLKCPAHQRIEGAESARCKHSCMLALITWVKMACSTQASLSPHPSSRTCPRI